MSPAAPDSDAVLTVTELTRAIAGVLEDQFGQVLVRGEVGRVTYASSGHIYFTLKDLGAVDGQFAGRSRRCSLSNSGRDSRRL